MWVAKIEFDGSNCALGSLCKKSGITLHGYPLKHKYYSNKLTVVMIGTIEGQQKNINKFLNTIQNSKKIIYFEHSGNILLCKFIEEIKLKKVYDEEIINIEPYSIDKTGKEKMILAAFNKDELMRIYKIFNKLYDAKLKYIKKEPIEHISFITKTPKITSTQKDAILLAIDQGYYEFPRKTSIKNLAKKRKLSFSTFQAHLRKAEKKLIPSYIH